MNKQSTQPGFFAAFFGFKRMVSPFFITLVYFLGLLAIIGGTVWVVMRAPQLIEMRTGLHLETIQMAWAYYAGIIAIGLLSILAWRFYCELLIVLFGIFNRLTDIKSLLQEPVNAAVSAARVKSTIAPVPIPVPEPELPEEKPVEDNDQVEEVVAEAENTDNAPSMEEILAEETPDVEPAMAVETEEKTVDAIIEDIQHDEDHSSDPARFSDEDVQDADGSNEKIMDAVIEEDQPAMEPASESDEMSVENTDHISTDVSKPEVEEQAVLNDENSDPVADESGDADERT